ncbi:DEAD-box ATP-dependent RNA helicase 7-like [Panicum virgatum]|uniref:DEAD-box ATP-dependent RNA helicase 7-like n=1 Tax=Panicum virgatum TaxID=38727 RepID=UPI0019D55C7A|nr:DEAD-box ATP-dependent RNA helicase 7-like [Panicum virgatum]
MPEEKLADVKGATLTADGTWVVFDVPAADVEDYIQASESAAQVIIDEVKQLPPLQERERAVKRQHRRWKIWSWRWKQIRWWWWPWRRQQVWWWRRQRWRWRRQRWRRQRLFWQGRRWQ